MFAFPSTEPVRRINGHSENTAFREWGSGSKVKLNETVNHKAHTHTHTGNTANV